MDLLSLLTKTVEGMGYELVDFETSPRTRLLRVFIDKPEKTGGVNVEDCAQVSNQLTRVMAVDHVDYDRLEVSSPGLDRALTKAADFERFAGFEITLKLRSPEKERRNFKGVLLGLRKEDSMALACDGVEYVFTLNQIAKARLLPKFD